LKAQLGVGATLREVFQIYRDHAGVLLPVAFWLFLVAAIVEGLAAEGGSISLFPVQIFVSTVVATLYGGMVVSLVRDVRDGRRDSSARELAGSAVPVLLPLIGAGILSGIGIGLGSLALIVPGLVLMTIWAVIAPVIVVERSGIIAAFGRSRALVRDHGWQVFGVVIIAFLITLAVLFAFLALAFVLVVAFVGVEGDAGSFSFVEIVLSAIASTLTAPITALAAAVLYYRLLAIERSAPPPPPQPKAASVLEQSGDGQG
jgi:hypothetical protein